MRPLVSFGALALVLAIGHAACTSGPSVASDDAYIDEIRTARAAKDKQFTEEREPVPAERRSAILPLKYYDVDPSFTVPASLEVADEQPVFEMPTSTGQLRKYRRVGVVEFTLQGQTMSLGAFVPADEEIQSLFVPFADLTTGKDTYPAGRYLDLHPTRTGLYTIDFNLAYNPYCAYNATYDCPFPPPSNRLKIEVRAGERSPGV